jgi:RNA polymerase sigma factor (sigma-70 family)
MRRRDPLARDLDVLLERVYAYVAYRIGPGPEAEDITAETFERALRYRRSYDVDRGEPVAWLIGIARSRLAEPRRVDPAPEPIAPEPFEELALDRLALGEAFRTLGPRDRELVALRYGADLTSLQIGAVLGMPRNAVDVALYRALARLRTALEEEARPAAS